MSDLNTFISNLSRTPNVGQTARGPLRFFVIWLAAVSSYVALLVYFHFTPRPDLMNRLHDPLFLAELVTLALLAITTSLSATLLAYPDNYQKGGLIYAPALIVILFIGVLTCETIYTPTLNRDQPHHIECLLAITLTSLPLAAWMFWRIQRMAPVKPMLTGATALLSCFSVGALTLRLSEETDSLPHLLTWHYIPMIGVSFLGVILGKKLLKW